MKERDPQTGFMLVYVTRWVKVTIRCSSGGVVPYVPSIWPPFVEPEDDLVKRCKTLKGKLFLEETAPANHHSMWSTCPVSEAVLGTSHSLFFLVQNANGIAHYYSYSTDEKAEFQMHFLHVEENYLNGTVSDIILAESTLNYYQTAKFEIPWWLACWHPTTLQVLYK